MEKSIGIPRWRFRIHSHNVHFLLFYENADSYENVEHRVQSNTLLECLSTYTPTIKAPKNAPIFC